MKMKGLILPDEASPFEMIQMLSKYKADFCSTTKVVWPESNSVQHPLPFWFDFIRILDSDKPYVVDRVYDLISKLDMAQFPDVVPVSERAIKFEERPSHITGKFYLTWDGRVHSRDLDLIQSLREDIEKAERNDEVVTLPSIQL